MKSQLDTLTESKHFKMVRVAEGVFAAISEPGTGSVGNAAIIDLGDSTLVVDTFTTIQAAEDLKAAATQLTGKSVAYVINTHWHSDHISGNQVFAPEAQIISTSTTRELMATIVNDRMEEFKADPEPVYQMIAEAEGKLQQETDEKLKQEIEWEIASDRAYMETLPDLVNTLPTITFEQQLTIYGENRIVQLHSYGGGHTQSDTFVYLPTEKIAIMGDLVLSKHHPVLFTANPEEWLAILERVEQLEIETIVPGHGEVCSMAELHEVKGYIQHIMALVEEALQTNGSIEDIAVPEAYQDWYFTTYFKANLQRIVDLKTNGVV
ncbi:cyclase [Bacillus sp. SORGH_AS 510]|uniref:MBL fold metallo-hydrolase n=1 Tax=Bacillus sp. SORGH_AS_0510 TaxID=3041771 RepID=UPI00278581FB|nr:MBL fold metallo-hydrolase [Bacillus sp. SORGH_AS_0510]MDQ1143686.1 cyclase [Bacillus sp. SORGH_AS_0510]